MAPTAAQGSAEPRLGRGRGPVTQYLRGLLRFWYSVKEPPTKKKVRMRARKPPGPWWVAVPLTLLLACEPADTESPAADAADTAAVGATPDTMLPSTDTAGPTEDTGRPGPDTAGPQDADDDADPDAGGALPLDPGTGGTVSSADGQATLTVPPGALAAPTAITIAKVADPVVTGELASAVWDLGPNGLTFQQPVTLCLKADLEAVKGQNTCLGYIDESTGTPTWKCEDECLEPKGGQLCGQTDHFTNFAVLLSGSGGGKGCDDDESTTWLGVSGGEATSTDGSVTLSVPKGALTTDTPLTIAKVAAPVVTGELASAVWDLGPNGLTFQQPVTLCLKADLEAVKGQNTCLGYIDESTGTPTWKCEDECLEPKGGQLCGQTDHFTNFAVLLSGSGGGKGCDGGADLVGPEGGMVTSEDGAAWVTVPAGALSAPVAITVAPGNALPTPQAAASVYDFGPGGQSFALPVTVCMKAGLAAAEAGTYCLGTLDPTADADPWGCADPCLTPDSPGFWCGRTTHFSSYSIIPLIGAPCPK